MFFRDAFVGFEYFVFVVIARMFFDDEFIKVNVYVDVNDEDIFFDFLII